MIHKIQAKNLIINDQKIIGFMRNNSIKHLKFRIEFDKDAYFSIEYPDYDNLMTLEKQWLKITYGPRKVYVRTPSILKGFAGKDLDIYQEEIFPVKFEAFRAKPVDFSIEDTKGKRGVGVNYPYFSSSGFLVIPDQYLRNNNFGNDILESRLSFNRTDGFLLNQGIMLCRITKEKEDYSFPLRRYANGVCTRRLSSFSDLVIGYGKDMRNFIYNSTIDETKTGHKLIAFEEVELDES